MVRKICPICDQVMKHSHYCGNCKSWVKHPFVRDVTYYLNERHPQKENNCSYHGKIAGEPFVTAVPGTTSKVKKTKEPPKATDTAGWILQSGKGNGQTGQVGKEYGDKKKENGVVWAAIVILVVVLVVSLSKAGMGVVESYFLPWSAETEAPSYEEPFNPWEWEDDYETDIQEETDWWENESRELTDEEVKDIGKACMGDGHFLHQGSELEELVRRLLNEQGYDQSMVGRYSYNIEYYLENGECTNSFFSSYINFTLAANGEIVYGNYVDIDCDTATGDLHAIEISMHDKEDAVELTVEILKYIEREWNLEAGFWSDTVRQELPEQIESEDGYDWTHEDAWISGSSYEDGYWITIDVAE